MATPCGDRNFRVRFERRAAASDGMGNTTGAWTLLFGPLMVRIVPEAGREQMEQQRQAGLQSFRLTVPSNEITQRARTSDRVWDVRKGVAYDIKSVSNPDGRNIELLFIVETGVGDG